MNGAALIKASEFTAESDCVYLKAWFDGREPDISKAIPVRKLPVNIWAPEILFPITDRTVVLYGDDISLTATATVKIDGVPADGFSVDGPRLIIEAAAESGRTVETKGIKYPLLFPSYSFTFTVAVP